MGWSCLKKQEYWEGHEQALIAIIRKETKRTEEFEEAGHRSPTWAVLRENGRNVTSFRAWPLWPATWVGYELGGSAPHQCR